MPTNQGPLIMLCQAGAGSIKAAGALKAEHLQAQAELHKGGRALACSGLQAAGWLQPSLLGCNGQPRHPWPHLTSPRACPVDRLQAACCLRPPPLS